MVKALRRQRETDSQQENVNKADQELGDGYALDLCVLTPRRWCELVGGGFASTGSREASWPSACRRGNRSGRRVRMLLRRGDPTGCSGSCCWSSTEKKYPLNGPNLIISRQKQPWEEPHPHNLPQKQAGRTPIDFSFLWRGVGQCANSYGKQEMTSNGFLDV